MVERKRHSELGSPKKQAHRCETGKGAIFGRRKKAILNWGDLDGKRRFVVMGKLFFSSFFSFLGNGPGRFCWGKPNWGRTGDEKEFLLKRQGRGLEKQILHEKLEELSWSVISGKILQKWGLLVGRNNFCWKVILNGERIWKRKKYIFLYVYIYFFARVSS